MEHQQRSYTLAGNFSTMPFPDLLSILELSRRTGLLSIVTPRALGELFLGDGQVWHAAFGNLLGAEAFYRMMAEVSGQFEFNTAALSRSCRRANVLRLGHRPDRGRRPPARRQPRAGGAQSEPAGLGRSGAQPRSAALAFLPTKRDRPPITPL